MKTAIVTGATRGIGKSIALALVDDGYQVIGVYEKSKNLAEKISQENKNIFFFQADVSNETDIKRLMEFVAKKSDSVEVLVNNAGMEKYAKLEQYLLGDWNKMLRVNLTSVFLMIKNCLPLLQKAEHAVIINISSSLGTPEDAISPYIVYGVTKAGVNMLTKGFAQELAGTKIRINAIFPPATKTNMIDYVLTEEEQKEMIMNGTLHQPEEVAKFVVKVINDESKNGEFISYN